MIVLAVTLPIRLECRDEAVKIALTMTAETHKEEGCAAYTFLSPLDNPNVLFVYEEWVDQAALDGHNTSEHMKVFQAGISELINGEVSVKKYLVE